MSQVKIQRPKFSFKEVPPLIQSLYGLSGVVRELPSERDQNFYFRETFGREYVLKISATAEKKEVLEFQNKAMELL